MSRGFVIRDRSATATQASCTAAVPADLSFFAGHFDDYPVLPAIAQIDALVLELAVESFPLLGPLRSCSRMKFRQTIHPGDELNVALTRESAQATTVAFVVSRAGAACSDGQLHFAEVAK